MVVLIAEGAAIRRMEQQLVQDHVHNARPAVVAGVPGILLVNATVLQSEIAGALAKGRPFGACYFDRADGLRIWSLRSDASDPDSKDVSVIAKAMGGGGHRHAAGFQSAVARIVYDY